MEQLGKKEISVLLFKTNNTTYGIQVTDIVNILESNDISVLEGAKNHLIGNLISETMVYPVSDFSILYGKKAREIGANSCIVVVSICYNTYLLHVGLLIDAVLGVNDASYSIDDNTLHIIDENGEVRENSDVKMVVPNDLYSFYEKKQLYHLYREYAISLENETVSAKS